MENPEPSGDEAGADEPMIEVEPPRYPWAETDDQALRSFIVEHYVDAEIDGRILIQNMQAIFQWVKDGHVPVKERR